jgi:hypothetical protein
MAKVRILLIPEHRNALLASLPPGRRVRALLNRATQTHVGEGLFADKYELICSLRDARILLETAKKSSPGAVESIETALKPH